VSEPKTIHVWLPEGRSLCDRRAYPGPKTGEQLEAAKRESKVAPACGACQIVASIIRRDAELAFSDASAVWPATPLESIEALAETRWELRYNLADLREAASGRTWSTLNGTPDA
jgi:hypothetical protein